MKNLNLLYNKNKKFIFDDYVKLMVLNQEDFGTAYVYCDNKIVKINFDEIYNEELYEADNIIAMEHLVLNNKLCLATTAGEILLLHLNSKTSEVITCCSDGIEGMQWSPDQEIIVIVTKAKMVVVMTCTYDPIVENCLYDTEFGNQEFINVGWGKKETQFHGSAGKTVALRNEKLPRIDCYTKIRKNCIISWRGDSELFAVSYLAEHGQMFKVYNKEGVLQFTSEKCASLEPVMCWRPSGLWIAVPQNFPNKYVIALFEKNGLRHRELVLPFKKDQETVHSIMWSFDSEVLLVETIKSNGTSAVYLYTICNYHWYLKQYLEFPDGLSAIKWNQILEEGKTLHILEKNGSYNIYRFNYTINHSSGLTTDDESMVAVIDGIRVLITNFRNIVIPPPMCGYSIASDCPINFIGFLKYPKLNDCYTTNTLFTVDSRYKFSIYNSEFSIDEFNVKHLTSIELINHYQFDLNEHIENNSIIYHHWLWLTKNLLIVCSSFENQSYIYLCEIIQDEYKIIVMDKKTVYGHISSMTNIDKHTFLVCDLTGLYYKLEIKNRTLSTLFKFFKLDHFCHKIECIKVNGECKVISLRNNQTLYINDKEFVNNVTSFFITEKFIVFTTIDKLKFIRYDKLTIVSERRIERGGRLIICVPKESRTILQMPRGNLETIQSRVLSLCIISDYLNSSLYKRAFELIRKQRINLNLIVDNNPEKFLSEVNLFLKEITNIQWLNLFLSELLNEDVTKTMYSSNYLLEAEPNYPDGYSVSSKVNIVCMRICDAMTDIDPISYILPIVTSHVKRGNFDHVLNLIWCIKREETSMIGDRQNNSIKAEEALNYLLYLVDVNDLYNVALGMYDFGLVLFVASKSQKDPREYIPFLNELKGFEINYRKYVIDLHLKRYEKALQNIILCGDKYFDECLALISEHKMYSKALILYKHNADACKKIGLIYADYLRTNGKLAESSLIYERAGDYQQALFTAKNILDWRRCITLANRKGYSYDELKKLSISLAAGLQANELHLEAVELLKLYQNDINIIVEALIKGKLFTQAIYEAYLCNNDAILNEIKKNLLEYAQQILTTINEDEKQYIAYKSRLHEVRLIQKKKLAQECDEEDGVDECDLMSDVSSNRSSNYTTGTHTTNKSHRSSKNRRKHERKLLSLKEGNPFEEIALINAIYTFIKKIYDQQCHIRDINKALIEMNFIEIGTDIQKTYKTLLQTITNSLDEIWLPEMTKAAQLTTTANIDYTQFQNDQRYSMLEPLQRFKPQLANVEWEYNILK